MASADSYRSDGPEVDRLISRRELRQLIPVSDMTTWRWVRAGILPPPIRIGGRNFWIARQVAAAIEHHASNSHAQHDEMRACSRTAAPSEG
jgi:predicted DNA-binding transcriptional regulator AlpA